MKEKLANEEILKEEKVMHLKSKLNALQGTLYLTTERLVLESHKTSVGTGGVVGLAAKALVEKKDFGFNLEFNEIKEITQGKHGRQKNVLEITDANGNLFRIIVKDYGEWEKEIKEKI